VGAEGISIAQPILIMKIFHHPRLSREALLDLQTVLELAAAAVIAALLMRWMP
jgi:hypothetical protein